MKPSLTRRYRRRSTPTKTEGAFFKKESQETFFGAAEHETFFQPAVTTAPAQSIQRKCDKCEEENNVQRAEDKKEEDKKVMKKEDKKEEEKVQRQPEKKEEEKVMKKEDKKEEEKIQRQPEKKEEEKVMKMVESKEKDKEKVQKKEGGASSGPSGSFSGYVSSLSGKGNTLPAQANYFFSFKMGHDFSNVKVHTDKEAAQSAKAINAKAYTLGNNIVFNESQYNLESGDGRKLMAHELTHVMQQSGQKQDAHLLRKKLAPDKSKMTTKGHVPGNTVICLKRWTYCSAPYSPGLWAATVIYHCPIFIWPGIILPGTTKEAYVTIPDEFIGTGPRGGRLYRCRNKALVFSVLSAADIAAAAATRMMLFPDFDSCHAGFRTNLTAALHIAFAPSGGGPSGIRVNGTIPVGGFPC
ncbi:MAG TPA: DUF4157 domain-containing protein [Chitinophagaceae bacterium]|nr:DUF4157 domain-containing protein [Chitinophagaceae bacterium]